MVPGTNPRPRPSGRDRALVRGGGRRTPLAAALPLPVLGRGPAPDAVDLIVAQRELQALPLDFAARADALGPRDLLFTRPGRGNGKEQVGVRGQAGTCGPPVDGAPGHGHHVSSRRSERVLYSRRQDRSALTAHRPFRAVLAVELHASLRLPAYTCNSKNCGDIRFGVCRGTGGGPGDTSRLTEHAAAELDQGIPDPRFDRAERDIQDAGHLTVGVPPVEGHRDGLSLQVAELIQTATEVLAVEGGGCGFVGLVPRRRGHDGLLFAGGGGHGTPNSVDGATMRDRHRPGDGAALGRVVAEGGAPEFEEYLLGDLLGLGRVPEHSTDLTLDRLPQLLVNEIEGPVLARA